MGCWLWMRVLDALSPTLRSVCAVSKQLIRGIKLSLHSTCCRFFLCVFFFFFLFKHRLSVGFESGYSCSMSFHEAFITTPCSYVQISVIGCYFVCELSRVESGLLTSSGSTLCAMCPCRLPLSWSVAWGGLTVQWRGGRGDVNAQILRLLAENETLFMLSE